MRKRNPSTAFVQLSISGKNLQIEALTDVLRIEPTDVLTSKYGEVMWEYTINAADALEGLIASLEELRIMFQQVTGTIKQFAQDNDLTVKVYVVISHRDKTSYCEGVSLERNFISFMNDMDAEFETDIYL